MLSVVPLSALGAAGVLAFCLYRWNRRPEIPGIFYFLTIVLPFAAGGFHGYTAAITALALLGNLIATARKNKKLIWVFNLDSTAVACVALAYCVTPFWAADRGMALFGILRAVPLLLYALTLMQLTPAQRGRCLELIPFTGALMTVSSCLLLLLPGTRGLLSVRGRLAGFFQYPNTFASFLLAGILLQYTKENRRPWEFVLDGILVLGVILSGSKTGFLLMLAAFLGILWIRGSKRLLVTLLAVGGIGLVAAVAASRWDALANATRFAEISLGSGTFLVRLLYCKDALPMILKNPFGYGYLGYRALEGTFQNGRYYVTFLHNELLQMAFDIGWLPTVLVAAAFLKAMLSRNTPSRSRLLLFILLGHCMLDFNLQFLIFWVILLPCLDFEGGKRDCLRGKWGLGLAGLCALLCLWLGTGDSLWNAGKPELCLRVTPFHTDAMEDCLKKLRDPGELDAMADRILRRNPTHSLAYSAKANAAFSEGRITDMMRNKEQAIRCARYTTGEYLDYFDKLWAVIPMYEAGGDSESARFCKKKLSDISTAMDRVNRATDPLAFTTGDDPTLALPEIYRERLRQTESGGTVEGTVK